ncbi:MAG: hypothetical protein ACE5FF_16120, partial [Saprospiraceae bacterium]
PIYPSGQNAAIYSISPSYLYIVQNHLKFQLYGKIVEFIGDWQKWQKSWILDESRVCQKKQAARMLTIAFSSSLLNKDTYQNRYPIKL